MQKKKAADLTHRETFQLGSGIHSLWQNIFPVLKQYQTFCGSCQRENWHYEKHAADRLRGQSATGSPHKQPKPTHSGFL